MPWTFSLCSCLRNSSSKPCWSRCLSESLCWVDYRRRIIIISCFYAGVKWFDTASDWQSSSNTIQVSGMKLKTLINVQNKSQLIKLHRVTVPALETGQYTYHAPIRHRGCTVQHGVRPSWTYSVALLSSPNRQDSYCNNQKTITKNDTCKFKCNCPDSSNIIICNIHIVDSHW